MIFGRIVAPAVLASLIALAPVAASAQEVDAVEASKLEQAAALMASVTEQFGVALQEMGLEADGVRLNLAPEVMASSIPSGFVDGDVGELQMEVAFQVRNEATATEPPENPEDFVLVTDSQGCVPAGMGEVAYFRTMTLQQAIGHQCVVVVQDGQGVWGLRGRSLAMAGDLRVLFIYHLSVRIDGRPERARELGETARDGVVRVSTTLADYTLAATALGQHRPIEDPVEAARMLGDMLEQTTALVVTHMPSSTTE